MRQNNRVKIGTVSANPWWDTPPFTVEIPARELHRWDIVKKPISKTVDAQEHMYDKMVELGATLIRAYSAFAGTGLRVTAIKVNGYQAGALRLYQPQGIDFS